MVVDAFVGFLEGLPPWLAVLLLAMVPIIELRGALPLGIFYYKMSLVEAAFWSVLGNLLLVPVILLFLGPVERFLRRWSIWDRFFTRLFDRSLRKLPERFKRFETAALVLFVGIPLPGTGAWTGAAVAHVLALGFWRGLVAITAGVMMAALLIGLMAIFARETLRAISGV